MTTLLTNQAKTDIIYPSSDGEPVAETFVHFRAISIIQGLLERYLLGQEVTVLANQFLYYSEGLPRIRIAPDVMVIFNVKSGGRDNYKIWEEKEIPSIIFEITSPSTKSEDQGYKKTLYQQLGVKEYWLFDPKGEWIKEQLIGYHLEAENYRLIQDNYSIVLNLKLKVEGGLIGFYREDTGEKLLIPQELADTLEQTRLELQQKDLTLQQKDLELQQEKQLRELTEQKLREMEEKLRVVLRLS